MGFSAKEIEDMAGWEIEAAVRSWMKVKRFSLDFLLEGLGLKGGKDEPQSEIKEEKTEIKEEDGKFEMTLDLNSNPTMFKKAFDKINKA